MSGFSKAFAKTWSDVRRGFTEAITGKDEPPEPPPPVPDEEPVEMIRGLTTRTRKLMDQIGKYIDKPEVKGNISRALHDNPDFEGRVGTYNYASYEDLDEILGYLTKHEFADQVAESLNHGCITACEPSSAGGSTVDDGADGR